MIFLSRFLGDVLSITRPAQRVTFEYRRNFIAIPKPEPNTKEIVDLLLDSLTIATVHIQNDDFIRGFRSWLLDARRFQLTPLLVIEFIYRFWNWRMNVGESGGSIAIDVEPKQGSNIWLDSTDEWHIQCVECGNAIFPRR